MMHIKANTAETRQGMVDIEKILQQKARSISVQHKHEVISPAFGTTNRPIAQQSTVESGENQHGGIAVSL